ncbi:hypothetical protein MASR2M29_04600 [Spirochaetota bacterium]
MESAFSDAAIEYRWLLNRNYSNSAALKLVGDKHQLPRDEILVLFRGIAPSSDAIRRRKLISTGCRGLELFVDGYNQILTVMHYLSSRPVFLADDGFLRDAGASHGRIFRPELFLLAMKLFAESLVQSGPVSVSAFF